jgi:hypothetical protein
VSRLVAADSTELDGPMDIFHTQDLGMLESELPAIPRRFVLTYHSLDGIDDDLVRSITDPMDILWSRRQATANISSIRVTHNLPSL